MSKSLSVAFCLAALLATVGVANGAIVSTTGAVTEISPPASVALGARESNLELAIFPEQASVTLGAGLGVDVIGTSFSGTGSPGTIPAGTVVDSWFVHFDTVGTTAVDLSGSATFTGPILGIQVFDASLNGTDAAWGAGATTYSSFGSRGLEAGGQDPFTLTNGRRTLNINAWSVSTAADQIRIFASPVPEPSTLALGGLGLVVLFGAARRRRARCA